jgi:hypothetical protein
MILSHLSPPTTRLLLSAALTLSLAIPSIAAPIAHCDTATFDFGTQPDTATVRHVFIIANTGDQPLTLPSVSACCGAKATLPKEPIPTNGTGEVSVELTLRGRHGAVNKAIYIATNDPQQPHLRIALTGNVQGGLVATPNRLVLTDSPGDVSTGAVVRLTSDTAGRVTNTWTAAPWLRTTVLSDSNGVAGVRVETIPPIPEGISAATVQVAVDKSPEVLSIPVTATRWEAVVTWPNQVLLSKAGPGVPPVERLVTLSANDNRPFRIRSVRCEGMAAQADIGPVAGGRWRIHLTDVTLPSATSTGTVIVATDHPLRPEIRIPVIAVGN